MMEEKLKIGIDIDEVVVEFVKGYLKIYERKYGKRKNVEDINVYDLWKPLGISKQEAIDLATEFYDSEEFINLSFVENARESLIKLQKKYNVYFISSRPEKIKGKTKTYFDLHFPKNGFEIIFSGDFYGGSKLKSQLCNDLEISLMIEDNADYALDLAKKGIKTFLLDKPWNQNVEEHENVIRVRNWDEIMERLK